ncbi:hypothetical protein GCM10023189_34630 [Nibrella saemangeumensis]|uniref:NodB homology domain-containing protein n=1 Tax=Nibrella saemangeumensis TaxID=1084526 RepID=A0ABP8N532_9BACT
MTYFNRRNLFLLTLLSVFSATTFSCSSGSKADSRQADQTSTESADVKTVSATDEDSKATPAAQTSTVDPTTIPPGKKADAATIIARQQVPILCYHQVRNWREKDSKTARDYIVPLDLFRQQMKMLADSGYHTISPDQLYAYLTTGAALPSKPIMLTFDDGDLDQYTDAVPIMNKHGFKGTFFIMTVAIGRRGKQPYMDKSQIKALSDAGHTIGCHTWDHHNVKKYEGKDWVTQIEEPTKKLEEITGKPVRYFAYPFGLWNYPATQELKKRNYLAAFQLAEKRDPQEPLYTVRRIIASGYWSPKTLHNAMVASFKGTK